MKQDWRFHYPDNAPMTHAADVEGWAINQKPKTSDWSDLKLYNYTGTDLYQWFGKKFIITEEASSVFRIRKYGSI